MTDDENKKKQVNGKKEWCKIRDVYEMMEKREKKKSDVL